VAGTAVGHDSVCHLVLYGRRGLLMRYLASASIGGLHMRDDASSGINSSISYKENQSPGFSFF